MPVFRRGTFSGLNKGKKEIKNIVIFGETGVGKSSLINLIADKKIAETSSNAVGCTLDYRRYLLKIEDQNFAVWDTAGLDEGTQGTVPAEKAEAYLKQLLHDLAKANSIDLLIYCVRGTRVRSALLANYHLFYSAICRKKVPIAIIVTGLENQEGNMDTWWLQNEKHFSALHMHFSGYACVTTLQSSMENPTLEERRKISRTAVKKMITSTSRTERWMPTERSWINTVFSDIHGMLSPREGRNTHVANIIMCDISRSGPFRPSVTKHSVDFRSPVVLSPSCARPVILRNPVLISNARSQSKLPFDEAIKCTPERLFRVYQVPRKETVSKDLDEEPEDVAVKRGADLLIFCAEKGGEHSAVKSQWEYFNLTYGGDLSPRIVVVIGATDPGSAEEWWKNAVGRTVTKSDASIAYWPGSKTTVGAEVAKRQLRDLINTCCIDCSQVSFARDEQIFKPDMSPRKLGKTRPASLWLRLPASNVGKPDRDITIVDQDVLTKWGVWEHVRVGRNSTNTRPSLSR